MNCYCRLFGYFFISLYFLNNSVWGTDSGQRIMLKALDKSFSPFTECTIEFYVKFSEITTLLRGAKMFFTILKSDHSSIQNDLITAIADHHHDYFNTTFTIWNPT